MNTTTNQNKRRRKKSKKQKKQKQNKQRQSQWTSLDVTTLFQNDNQMSSSTSHATTTHISSKHSQNSISHEKSQQMNNNWRSNTPITSPPRHNSHNQPSQPQLKEYIGTIKCYKPDRQFGYITCNDLKTDIFFHATSFIQQQAIQNIVGNSVKFNINAYNNKYNGEERQKAINISIIKTNSTAIIINNTVSNINNANWRTTAPNWRNNNGNTPIKPYSAVISSKTSTCTAFNWRDQCRTKTSTSTCTAPESSRGLYETGTLLFLDCVRNFGFISCDNSHANDMNINDKNHLFVHGSEIKFDKSEIYKGMRVEFIIKYYNNGKRKAIDVNISTHNINDNESIISCSSISSSISSINSYIPKYRGTLVYYNSNKKHGFIRCHNENILKDVFVYESEFKFPKRFIKIDINVKFDIEMYKNKQNENAKRAVHVMLDNGASMTNSKEMGAGTVSVFEQRSKDSKWRRFRIEKCAKIEEEREDKEEKIEVIEQSSDLNKDANVFVPENIQQMKKILSTIEEVNEIVMDTQKVAVASKVVEIREVKQEVTCVRVSKLGININKLFNRYKKQGNGHELIAKKLYGLMNDKCDLEDVFLKLFELKKKIQQLDVFLFSVLEVLSLIEGSKSIFMLIGMRDMISKYLNKILCNNYSVNVYNEFKEYGLQCLYPLMNDEYNILNKCNNLQDLLVNKCYNFRYYDIMYKIYCKIIPKYCNDNNMFTFIKKMVCDKDIDDSDNNDKLVLLSVIISIFMENNNLEKEELCNFIKQLCDRNILSLDVINKWRLDEFDMITINKQKSLVILGDLIYDLDRAHKDIVENDESTTSMSDNEEDDDVYDSIDNGYISSCNLLQQNDNHNPANRCPWRQ